MKRILTSIIFAAAAILTLASCHDKINEEIQALKKTATEIEGEVSRINSSISNLSALITALEQNDHIVSIIPYTSSKGNGYIISFESGQTLTLPDGTDGVTPILGVRLSDNGVYYWTVQAGPDGEITWMTDASGLKVRANAVVPRMRIEEDYWSISYDEGKTWTVMKKWGKTVGDAGTSVFLNITPFPYYVEFQLANKTKFQIATKLGFDEISASCDSVNAKMDTYTKIIGDLDSASIFITSVDSLANNGYCIHFANGKQITINSGKDKSDSLFLGIKKDTDGIQYWTMATSSKAEKQWILKDGKKLPAVPTSSTPVIGVADSAGVLYFTVRYGGEKAEMMRDSTGKAVEARGRAGFRVFDSVNLSDPYFVTLKLADSDSTVIKVPRLREHTPSMTVSSKGGFTKLKASQKDTVLAVVIDTVSISATDYLSATYNDYVKLTKADFTAIALDDGYVTKIIPSIKPVNYLESSKEAVFEVTYAIAFEAGSNTGTDWGSKKTRIAAFYTWNNRTIMKTIEYAHEVDPV